MTIQRLSSNTIGVQDGSIWREDINVTLPDHAVITKVIPGDNVRIVSSGATDGTGDVVIHFDPSADPVLTPTEYKLDNRVVSTRTRLNFMSSGELSFIPIDDSVNDQTTLAVQVGSIDYGKIRNQPTTLAGLGITDSTSITTFNSHALDSSIHVTYAQKDLLNTLSVTATELNYLGGLNTNVQTQLNAKEPSLAPGSVSQYYRGDKTFASLNKTAVGLNLVDNTPDTDKPISTATKSALDLKADQSSLLTESTRALAAEALLAPQISTFTKTEVTDAIAVETTRATTRESQLQTSINNLLTNTDATALNSLSEVVTAFSNADSTINGAITTLSNTASTNLTTEVNRATTAEATLTTNLSTHSSDTTKHLTSAQNTLLDGIELGGTTASELNVIHNSSVTNADLVKLHAVSASSTELNYLVGLTSNAQSQINTKVDTTTNNTALALKADKTYVDSQDSAEVVARNTAIATETTRAQNAESALNTTLTTHSSDDTRHLTSTQNTLLDGITVSYSNINSLTSINGNVQSQLDAKAHISGSTTQNFDANTLTVSTSILPATNSLLDIGSPTQRFKTIYVDEAKLSTNTLYIGDTPILGTSANTINIHSDINQSIDIATSGTGTTTIESAKAVTLTTSGLNADVLVNATGAGSNVRLGATNELQVTATNAVFNCPVTAVSQSITGNLTVGGNLTINGTTTSVNSTNTTIHDNIITINSGEVGSGVTLAKAGLQVDRGDLVDYQLVFDETDDYFKVGAVGALEVLATQPWVDGKFSVLTHNHTVDTLSNVQLTSVADNQFLRRSGTNWINTILSASDIPSLDYSKITTGKPSTVSGYGITDSYTKAEVDALIAKAISDFAATLYV